MTMDGVSCVGISGSSVPLSGSGLLHASSILVVNAARDIISVVFMI